MNKVRSVAHHRCQAKNIYHQKINDVLSELKKLLPSSIDTKKELFCSVKLFERDEKIISAYQIQNNEEIIVRLENELDDDSESIITDARYSYITHIIEECYRKGNHEKLTTSDKIDRIVTNRVLALPIFTFVMFIVYYVSVTTVGTFVTDWTNDVLFGEIIPPAIESFLTSIHCASWLQGLILDGIVAGVGAVLGFVPQMFVLFAFLAVLEDCGYMARIAFIMDRIFRKFGLSGKSFIPMLIGSGCGVPGIMASRTIESDRDRKMTIITTTFIPCGAKLPIIALIAGALFGGAAWVSPSCYFLGVAAIIISGIILKKTKLFVGDPAPFVMEMPEYHLPRIINVLRSMWERGWSFIKKAGTIILLSTIVIWFLQTFGTHLNVVEDSKDSILAVVSGRLAPVFRPLGFGDWRVSTALLTGFMAKESVVSTLSVLFGTTAQLTEILTPVSALSLLVFCLLYTPCVAAVASIKRELGGRWAAGVVVSQCVIAWLAAFVVHGFALLFGM